MGNDPRYNKTRCFETFPFPCRRHRPDPRPSPTASAPLAEQIDAHRKARAGGARVRHADRPLQRARQAAQRRGADGQGQGAARGKASVGVLTHACTTSSTPRSCCRPTAGPTWARCPGHDEAARATWTESVARTPGRAEREARSRESRRHRALASPACQGPGASRLHGQPATAADPGRACPPRPGPPPWSEYACRRPMPRRLPRSSSRRRPWPSALPG
ncbi:MAG: hypothetical protein MZW92_81180 [Comamonadaceae bacterium]|nr:hypothetical protein [Comamonadaceae bacterium]